MKQNKSDALYKEALQYFPGGVNSPVRAFRAVGGTPIFVARGNGSHIWDADDNKYIDFCCSWGPLILGHNNPQVRKAIIEAVEHGTSFGMPTEAENRLAQLIIDNHRFIEKLRFVSSGTEAVMSALRLARGYTGRSKVIKFEGCYHGHADSLLVKAGSGLITFGESTSAGVPPSFASETIVVSLADLAAVENIFKHQPDDIAAVIIEPIPANNGLLLQEETFLQGLRNLCTEYGALLIFDEVISGFRLGFEGAAGYYNIQPDIITFGKIIGGGMPVGAYGANREIMSHISPDGPVYQAGTLSGNPVAMAAGRAALEQCLTEGFYENLREKNERFCGFINAYCREKHYVAQMFHIESIFWIAFTEAQAVRSAEQIDPQGMQHFKKLHRQLLDKGIYLGPSGYEVGFISAAHSDSDLAYTVEAFCCSLDAVFEHSN